jgi:high-affinity Fe2+/Pb2+ permease
MAQDLFSVTIFFVVFRETLEAAIIVSVLLSLVEQIVQEQPDLAPTEQTLTIPTPPNNSDPAIEQSAAHEHSTARDMEKLTLGPQIIRKLRLQVYIMSHHVGVCALASYSIDRFSSEPLSGFLLRSPLVLHSLPSGSPRPRTSGPSLNSCGKVRPPTNLIREVLTVPLF